MFGEAIFGALKTAKKHESKLGSIKHFNNKKQRRKMKTKIQIEIKNKNNFLLIETPSHGWLRVEKGLVDLVELATSKKLEGTLKNDFIFFEEDSEIPKFLKQLNKATGLSLKKQDFLKIDQQNNPIY